MKKILLFILLLLGFVPGVEAHLGSPNVFYEGEAGPYQVRVSIRPPEVVPGRAQINVRVHNGSAGKVTALPVRWDAGRKGAPPPDEALPVQGEPGLYSTELWLMDFGAYSVFVDVEGALGKGTAIVPLNSVSTQRLEMPRWLGAVFLTAGGILFLLLVMIIGAAVRESVLPPGTTVSPRLARRGRYGMAGGAVVLMLILIRGNAWWKEVDTEFRNNRLFKPVEVPSAIEARETGRVLTLQIDPGGENWKDATPLVADHGKLMHLFLIREPALDAFAHLHPMKTGEHSFETPLTGSATVPAGEYSVYADVTHESGLTRTLVSKLTIPEAGSGNSERAADPDDSSFQGSTKAAEFPLGNGHVVRSLGPATVEAGRELSLRFDVLAEDGKPALLEPYLGMWSHAVVRSRDGSVFTHLHPQGTISMASQVLFARRERGENLSKPIDVICGRPERELVFPYLFPRAGEYRVWVQVKSGGRVHTAAFDFTVLPEAGT